MKTVIVIIILLFCLFYGFSQKKRLKKRISSLEKCIVMFDSVQMQVNYSLRDMQEVLKQISENVKLEFLAELINSDKDDSIQNRWRMSLNKASYKDCFKKEDIEILFSFANLLGVTDTDGQKQNCETHKTLIESSLSDAREEYKNKGNLVTTLSLLFGLTVIVFIL